MRHHIRTIGADLIRIQQVSGTRWVALRAGFCVGVALSVLLWMGRLEWGVYAVFGVFASVYGGRVPFTGRWLRQGQAALMLVGSVVTGTAVGVSEYRTWLVIPAVTLCAVVTGLLSDRLRWVPPGPIFAVFACGACASVPVSPAMVPVALGLAASSAGFAVAVGWVEERVRRIAAEPGMGRSPWPLRRDRVKVQALRLLVCVPLVGVAMTASGIGHPYWAMVAVVVPMVPAPVHGQVVRGINRGAGTVGGIGVAWVLLSLPLEGLALIAVAVVLQALAEFSVVRHYGIAMLCITPLALVMGQLAARLPVHELLVDRLVETVVGAVVGIIAVVVTRDRGTAGTAAPAPAAD